VQDAALSATMIPKIARATCFFIADQQEAPQRWLQVPMPLPKVSRKQGICSVKQDLIVNYQVRSMYRNRLYQYKRSKPILGAKG